MRSYENVVLDIMLISEQAAVETLHALYSRSSIDTEDFQPLIHLMYETDYLTMIQKLYEWSIVGPNEVEETRYTLSKKLSEVPPANLILYKAYTDHER